MTDWNNPQTSNIHTNELSATRGRDESNAKMDYSADSNFPDGTIKWNPTSQKWEKWDASAGTWDVLSSKYDIDVSEADNADTLENNNSAWHLDRVNHTGTQALSTISDSGTAAAENDTRYAHRANNLSDLGSAVSGRGNLNIPSALKDGGADELDISELAGGLGTSGQVVETDGAALSYVEPDNRYAPKSHAAMHKDGGAGELDVAELAGALGTNGQVPVSDGAAVSWEESTPADSVGQSELKTTTGSISTTNNTGVNLILPGGQYGFYPQLKSSADQSPAYWGYDALNDISKEAAKVNSLSYESVLCLGSTGADTAYALQRYIQSSPPYNLGDSVVMGFVYVQLDNDGNIINTYIAEDPPWYGNTSKNPARQYMGEDGKEYAKFRRSKYQQSGKLEDFGVIETVTREITTELKNEGMDELPHPFSTNKNVVLLDSVDEDLTYRIVQEMLAGGTPEDIFKKGYAKVDNTKLNRKGPPNMPIHKAKWK